MKDLLKPSEYTESERKISQAKIPKKSPYLGKMSVIGSEGKCCCSTWVSSWMPKMNKKMKEKRVRYVWIKYSWKGSLTIKIPTAWLVKYVFPEWLYCILFEILNRYLFPLVLLIENICGMCLQKSRNCIKRNYYGSGQAWMRFNIISQNEFRYPIYIEEHSNHLHSFVFWD